MAKITKIKIPLASSSLNQIKISTVPYRGDPNAGAVELADWIFDNTPGSFYKTVKQQWNKRDRQLKEELKNLKEQVKNGWI